MYPLFLSRALSFGSCPITSSILTLEILPYPKFPNDCAFSLLILLHFSCRIRSSDKHFNYSFLTYFPPLFIFIIVFLLYSLSILLNPSYSSLLSSLYMLRHLTAMYKSGTPKYVSTVQTPGFQDPDTHIQCRITMGCRRLSLLYLPPSTHSILFLGGI